MTLALEHHRPSASIVARWDARWKVAALVPAVFAAAAVRSLPASTAAFAEALILALVARLPLRWLAFRLLVVVVALLPFLLLLPFTIDRGATLWEQGRLRMSAEGWTVALALALKTLAIATLALFVLASAPIHTTLLATQRLRVPALLVQLALMSYRYVFLLAGEFARIRTALRVRGFRNRPDRQSYRTIGQVTGTLLVRSAERADRVAQAMRCRGFDGHLRSLTEFRTSVRDVALFALVVAFAGALLLYDRLEIGSSF